MAHSALNILQGRWKDFVLQQVHSVHPKDLWLYQQLVNRQWVEAEPPSELDLEAVQYGEIEGWRAIWHHFHLFTREGRYASTSKRATLEVGTSLSLDLDFNPSINHGAFPYQYDWIGGIPVPGKPNQAAELNPWFSVSHPLRILIGSVQAGLLPTNYNPHELRQEMLDGSEDCLALYHTALLVFRESIGVNAVADWYSTSKEPAAVQRFMHTISYRLDSPQWWSEFQAALKQRGITPKHSDRQCVGCTAEYQ